MESPPKVNGHTPYCEIDPEPEDISVRELKITEDEPSMPPPGYYPYPPPQYPYPPSGNSGGETARKWIGTIGGLLVIVIAVITVLITMAKQMQHLEDEIASMRTEGRTAAELTIHVEVESTGNLKVKSAHAHQGTYQVPVQPNPNIKQQNYAGDHPADPNDIRTAAKR
jgi:hypothetical protein